MDTNFWADLIRLNKRTDSLIERCIKDVRPSEPIAREVPVYVSVENRFENLPLTFAAALSTASDLQSGNNIKQAVWTNSGARVYIREISMHAFLGVSLTNESPTYDCRVENNGITPFNWRWNFMTSITQKWYSRHRCLASAGGRDSAGTHLSFKNPLVVEPMETFIFECELVAAGMVRVGLEANEFNIATVAMALSGYREGV